MKSKKALWITLINFVILVLGMVGAVGYKELLGLFSTVEEVEKIKEIPGLFMSGHPAFLSLAVAAIGLITFFSALGLNESNALSIEGRMRRAITVAVVTVYLVLVSTVAFYVPWEKISEVTRTLVKSFTATVSVIVAFFFGASAFLESRPAGQNEKSKTSPPQDDA